MFKFSLTFVLLAASAVFSAPTPTPNGSGLLNGANPLAKRVTHTGRGTWFHPGLGNCGSWDDDNAPIVAVSTAMYKGGDNCNQWMKLTANGKSVYAKMRDSCPSCGYNDVDLSPKAFEALAPLDDGVVTVSWHYMSRSFSP